MSLNPVDIEVVYMKHMSLPLIKSLVVRLWLEPKCAWANI